MGFLDRLKELSQQASTQAQEGWSRFNNAGFADATMSACALIAAADGHIDPSERTRTAQFITSSDKLKAFNVNDLRSKYENFCDVVSRDFDFGKIELMQKVSRVAGKPDEARAVVQVALVIANADGEFSADEQRVMREIIFALKLEPREFGLE